MCTLPFLRISFDSPNHKPLLKSTLIVPNQSQLIAHKSGPIHMLEATSCIQAGIFQRTPRWAPTRRVINRTITSTRQKLFNSRTIQPKLANDEYLNSTRNRIRAQNFLHTHVGVWTRLGFDTNVGRLPTAKL